MGKSCSFISTFQNVFQIFEIIHTPTDIKSEMDLLVSFKKMQLQTLANIINFEL